MPLFSDKQNKGLEQNKTKERHFDTEVNLEEDLSELVAREKPRAVSRAMSQADEAVHEAAREKITRITLIEQGCCPECRGRIENFLYTQVCLSCGWFRRMVPDFGRCVVHMQSGESILCDRVFPAHGDQFLCVTGGVVRSQVMKQYVQRIEYVWEEQELKEAQETVKKRVHGTCSWCERNLQDGAEEDKLLEEYVSFGAMQERYVFCSLRCLGAFRKQYPPRVHRNCYETDCNVCNQCIKRYDAEGFKRVVLTR